MQYHVGRLIDHVHLKVRDLAASRGFYDAAFGALGLPLTQGGSGYFHADELFVSTAKPPHEPLTTGLHLAFQASDRDAVHRFHAAVLAAGGRDNGGPGERSYHPATMVHSHSIPTATMSRPCTTDRCNAPHRRSSSCP